MLGADSLGLRRAETVVARKPDHLAAGFEVENTGGMLSGLLAEEDVLDRRALWRLGSWGAGAVGAVIVAVAANQSALTLQRDQIAATDLARQSEQLQSVARESQNEARRLSSAIDTLNGDRDRLYSRVTVLEQGLDSVTGAIARQSALAASPPAAPTSPAVTELPSMAQNPFPAPAVAAVASTQAKTPDKTPEKTADKTSDKTADKIADKTSEKTVDKPPDKTADKTLDKIAEKSSSDANPAVAAVAVASTPPKTSAAPTATPATPLVAAKSIMAPPDAAAGKLIEPTKSASLPAAAPAPDVVASVSPAAEQADASENAPKLPIQRTEFAVDVGGANSLGGLRALWRGLLKSHVALASLRPVIAIRESSTGLGMQLRLLAGPLDDAAAAAKICAGLMENERPCATTLFDGQRLAMKADEQPATTKGADGPPDAAKPAITKPAAHKRGLAKRAANDEPFRRSEPSLSSLFGKRQN